VPDIPVLQVSALHGEGAAGAPSSAGPADVWALDIPRQRWPSPIALAALGVVAGIAAMVLGGVAVVSAETTDGASPQRAVPLAQNRAKPQVSAIERQVLSLLAKPSTQRVVFRNSGGALVLAVGSGGRAAILIRGLERAAPGQRYRAWVLAPGEPPVRAAAFGRTERAVFLSASVGRNASVVVSSGRRVPVRLGESSIVAARG
jgi:hypothetical protein